MRSSSSNGLVTRETREQAYVTLCPVRRLATPLLVLAIAGCGGDERAAPRSEGMEVRTVAEGLEVPWEIAFLPDRSALITERPGRVRVLEANGELREEPVATVDVSAQGEGGLMGLALDPEFAGNGLVYLYFTTAEGLKLERWRYAGGELTRDATLVSDIQAGPIHDSGRIAFGPDELLHVATGDAGDGDLAQDDASLNGKYLRLAPEQYRGDGEVRPEVYSKGHRNPQGFDWDERGRLISTEHGPSGGDGPQGYDELNLVRAGGNYGWPEAIGTDHEGFDAPLRVYEEAIAPAGATFVGREGSAWTGDYLFATLRGETLYRLRLRGGRIAEQELLLEGEYGRLRTVVEGPDGGIYVLTSNRDGRGDPDDGDDRILRITPPDRPDATG
jgi:glucose/arabinose dehydrogenase